MSITSTHEKRSSSCSDGIALEYVSWLLCTTARAVHPTLQVFGQVGKQRYLSLKVCHGEVEATSQNSGQPNAGAASTAYTPFSIARTMESITFLTVTSHVYPVWQGVDPWIHYPGY